MAHLTGTQKKERRNFIALLVAIVLVLAATLYVGYAAFMAKSAFLENQDFATALATAFDKSERSVSKDDLAAVKYMEFVNSGESASIYLGGDDFLAKYNEYSDEQEAIEVAKEQGLETTPTVEFPVDLAKSGAFETGEDFATLKDLGYFTGIEVAYVAGIELDAETLANFKNIKEMTFDGCTISDEALAAFAGAINKEAVEELVFSNPSIEDWAPLADISDKVTISSFYYTMDEEGNFVPESSEQTLTEYLAEKAAAEEEAAKAESEEATEETVEETTEENAEENTNEVTE